MVKRYQAPVIAHTDFVLASDYERLEELYNEARLLLVRYGQSYGDVRKFLGTDYASAKPGNAMPQKRTRLNMKPLYLLIALVLTLAFAAALLCQHDQPGVTCMKKHVDGTWSCAPQKGGEE